MKISVRNLEPTKVKLTVTVEPEELNPYLDAARKEIASVRATFPARSSTSASVSPPSPVRP